MIRLKSLLEQSSNTKKLNILFIGDQEIKSKISFANRIFKKLNANVKIVGWKNLTSRQILKIVNKMISPKWDIITIMSPGADGRAPSPAPAIQQLTTAFKLAKKFNAKLIAVSNPTKKYLTNTDKLYKSHEYPSTDLIGQWVNTQLISNAIIDVSDPDQSKFNSDHVSLTSETHNELSNKWLSIMYTFNLRIIPKENEKSAEDDDNNQLGKSNNIPRTKTTSQYVIAYAPIAVKQMKKYGIPASIILAQGIIESGNGKSSLTVQAFNHFGIKGSYNGETWCGKTTEFRNGVKGKERACFRSYPNDEASFEDRSKLLMNKRYIEQTKGLAVTDYIGWANALKAAGYATAPNYAQILIDTIERLGLNEYDSDLSLKSILNSTEKIGQEFFGSGAGQLPGNKGGGDNGDWAGSLPKLISILPPGIWKGGHKRARKHTKGGSTSDHYLGKTNAYAVDFMLSKAFDNNEEKATNFAIALAQNAGKQIDSWQPYEGKYLNVYTNDGYRVQIIWKSLVGGNHYDHVHVGIRKT